MSEPRRETMIALRARRQAYKVAADILYDEPIDVDRVTCSSCGQMIDWRRSDLPGDAIACPACYAVTSLPPHLRAKAPCRTREDARFHQNLSAKDCPESVERLSHRGIMQLIASALLLVSVICFMVLLFA